MAIAYDEFDARIDAVVAAFEHDAFATLRRQLPSAPTVHKGPYRKGEPGASDFAVFISRGGVPNVKYDMGTQTADVTMSIDIAATSYSLADAPDLEGHINVFGANIMAVLFSLVKRAGADGWYNGMWQGSDAVTLRNEKQQTSELEVFQFDVTFEVNYA